MAISGLGNWWQAHPRATSIGLGLGGIMTAYGAVEAIWAAFSEDPLVPVIGKIVEPLWDDALRVAGILFVLSLAALLTWSHLKLSEAVSEMAEREYAIPDYALQLVDPSVLVVSGSDTDIALTLTDATHKPLDYTMYKEVLFSVRQAR